MVISGEAANRGSNVGKVIRVLPGDSPDQDRVIVEGINVRKRHMKKSQQNPQGGVVEKAMPIHASRVLPVIDGKPTRVRFETRDGQKVRVSVKTGQVIGQPLSKKG